MLPLKGVGVSVADFGTTATYPTVGIFSPAIVLDPTGNTPDLALPITFSSAAITPGMPLFEYQHFPTVAQPLIPAADATSLAVIQFPPGDSGLLGVGGDQQTSSLGTSGYTTDGFTTPAVMPSFLDLGIAIGQDNNVPFFPCPAPTGRLRAQTLTSAGIMAGDHLTTIVRGGDTLNLSFFGSKAGDKWRLYFNASPCTPAVAIGPVLPTIPDADGDGSYLRINAAFPTGFAGSTIRFSAVWGNAGCFPVGHGFTNCVTIIVGPDPVWGIVDDCTIENGWVLQIPSASSDFFNNSFGPKPSNVVAVTGLTISVLDFVTATPAFPACGISTANVGLDLSGNTPSLVGPVCLH